MSYSFFGTCFEDTELLVEGLRSMANQTIIPNEIITTKHAAIKVTKAALFGKKSFLII